MQPMSRNKFFRKMKELDKMDDTESKHSKADDLLCEVLNSLGYEKGVEVFQYMSKWCS